MRVSPGPSRPNNDSGTVGTLKETNAALQIMTQAIKLPLPIFRFL